VAQVQTKRASTDSSQVSDSFLKRPLHPLFGRRPASSRQVGISGAAGNINSQNRTPSPDPFNHLKTRPDPAGLALRTFI